MKKSILMLVLALMMILSSAVSAEGVSEPVELDVFNNDVLKIVATMQESPSKVSGWATLVYENLRVDYDEETGKNFLFSEKRYSDGAYTYDKIVETNAFHAEKATRHFPAYINGDAAGMYVVYEMSEEKYGDNCYQDIFLVETAGYPKKVLIASLVYDGETDTYMTFSTKVVNGAVVRTPSSDKPISKEELMVLRGESVYNDGLKFGKVDEESGLKGFSDINDKVYFTDFQLSYTNYFYNLGYLVFSSNNGDILDYSVEDYEKQRVYTSELTNIFTDETYIFNDVDIMDIYDTGYALVAVKDEQRVETMYLAKLKPAIVTVSLNGQKIHFDVIPVSENGRTLVPLRAIFEVLGAQVTWDAENQLVRAIKGTTNVEIKLGALRMKVSGETKTLDVPAKAIDGRTMVPVRAISEAFNCKVDWDGETNAVLLSN